MFGDFHQNIYREVTIDPENEQWQDRENLSWNTEWKGR